MTQGHLLGNVHPADIRFGSQMSACALCLHAGLRWLLAFDSAKKKCTAKVDVIRGHTKRVWQARYMVIGGIVS